MTRNLDWGPAEPNDFTELSTFTCTKPAPPMAKGTPVKHRHLAGDYWEREVQVGINGLHAPVPTNELLLIGRDSGGIGAVSHSFEVGSPAEVKILAAAVALRARGRGYGDELLEETMLWLIERADAAKLEQLRIWGLVHPRNGNSQALVERHDFIYVGDDEDGYQEWWQVIDLRY